LENTRRRRAKHTLAIYCGLPRVFKNQSSIGGRGRAVEGHGRESQIVATALRAGLIDGPLEQRSEKRLTLFVEHLRSSAGLPLLVLSRACLGKNSDILTQKPTA
jgi:hypothetical protein